VIPRDHALPAIPFEAAWQVGQGEPRHRSREFIALLERLHAHCPGEAVIRVVLDNHRAHLSKETMAYLASRPGRFEFVHTPRHGSWLNLVESAFSKMVRSFLRHIRVASLDELKERIIKGIDEMNAQSVRFQWKSFDFQMTETSSFWRNDVPGIMSRASAQPIPWVADRAQVRARLAAVRMPARAVPGP